MYHSIIFQKCSDDGTIIDSKNTWSDWHLVPSSRPLFNPPAQKTRFLDIPGADGFLDMSDALTGYPVFENRQGSFDFIVINESDELSAPGTRYGQWYQRYTEIMEFLHGKVLRAILEDDSEYFYEGRFSVNAWASEEVRSKITIDYTVKPYKRSVLTSLDPNWLWDELDFSETSSTPNATNLNASSFNEISINTTNLNPWESVVVNQSDLGVAPTCPVIRIVSASTNIQNVGYGLQFKMDDESDDKAHNLTVGDHKLSDVVLFGKSQYEFKFKGRGTVSIVFREGRL